MSDTLLQVRDLQVHYPLKGGFLKPKILLKAVDGVSFDIERGRTFGIVGESGSGKSTTALAVMRLAPVTAGHVTLGDAPISTLQGEALRLQRKRFQMVFQDPFASLNPRVRAGQAIRDALDLMDVGAPAERDALARTLFMQAGLRPEQMQLFPHQFSGGQRQRIALARALAGRPELLVCDEPVSALDVAIQAQILNLMQRLQKELGLTYLFISHDLGVVEHVAHRVAVMYLGRIVEMGSRERIFSAPTHPYTEALMAAAPVADPRLKRERLLIEGDVPSPINPPAGCHFHTRCPLAQERCRREAPTLRPVAEGHVVACHLRT